MFWTIVGAILLAALILFIIANNLGLTFDILGILITVAFWCAFGFGAYSLINWLDSKYSGNGYVKGSTESKSYVSTLPTTPHKKVISPAATIDVDSLLLTTESQTISGSFSNIAGGAISIKIWKGWIKLPTTGSPSQQSIYYDSSDHGGEVELYSADSSSGRYSDKIWQLLPEGEYTVGIYTFNNIYTEEGYQGNTTPILLTTGFIKVISR